MATESKPATTPMKQQQTNTAQRALTPSTDLEKMTSEITEAVVAYSKNQPASVACVIFMAGFFVGWKLKPW